MTSKEIFKISLAFQYLQRFGNRIRFSETITFLLFCLYVAQSTDISYSCTGTTKTFIVPQNVKNIRIVIAGAQGAASGGFGAKFETTVLVSKDDIFYLYVGCNSGFNGGGKGNTNGGGASGKVSMYTNNFI